MKQNISKVEPGNGRKRLKLVSTKPAEALDSNPESDSFKDCVNAALRFVNYRPRSEYEVRQRMTRHGFENNIIDNTIAELKKQGLLDDLAFAEAWKDDRDSFNPRSRWLLKMELRKKGIAEDILEQATGAINDEDNAYRAATVKTRSWQKSDYESFKLRLGDYLKRRGFDYRIINIVAKRVWEESTPSASAATYGISGDYIQQRKEE